MHVIIVVEDRPSVWRRRAHGAMRARGRASRLDIHQYHSHASSNPFEISSGFPTLSHEREKAREGFHRRGRRAPARGDPARQGSLLNIVSRILAIIG
jgi:hypothetical protein